MLASSSAPGIAPTAPGMLSAADAPVRFELHARDAQATRPLGPELLRNIAPATPEMLCPADAPRWYGMHGTDAPVQRGGVPQNIAPAVPEMLCPADAPEQREMHGKGVPSQRRRGEENLTPAQKKRLREFKTERYAVRLPMKNDILLRLKVGEPTIDLFADQELHMCPRWFGHGGEHLNSFEMDWGREELGWCNPPFSRLQEVVQKIVDDRAKVILIMPHWTSNQWFHDIQPYVQRKYFYKKGTLFFEQRAGLVGGLPWPVWALLVDGGLRREEKKGTMTVDADEPVFKETISKRHRRRRRGYHEEELC